MIYKLRGRIVGVYGCRCCGAGTATTGFGAVKAQPSNPMRKKGKMAAAIGLEPMTR